MKTQIPIEWKQFKEALKVFTNDYQIVNHPDTLPRSPFEIPNQPDQHKRQYNLTQLPETMNEEEFKSKFSQIDTIALVCMDRDEALPAYEKLQQEGKKIMYISVAGGVVQKETERLEALKTILIYASQLDSNNRIEEIILADHNHNCGKVGKDYGQKFTELLQIEPATPQENIPMKELIAYYSQSLIDIFIGKTRMALINIDRQGNAEFDFDFEGIKPKNHEQIKQEYQH